MLIHLELLHSTTIKNFKFHNDIVNFLNSISLGVHQLKKKKTISPSPINISIEPRYSRSIRRVEKNDEVVFPSWKIPLA